MPDYNIFKTFYNDLTYLPKRKFNAKYTVPFMVFLLSCVLVGQLITIAIPLNQLNKVSGQIIDMRTVISSRSHARFDHHTPNYALAITLENMQSFNIEEQDTRVSLSSKLKKGNHIIIYYPSSTLKLIGAGLLRDVSQVEFEGKVLYAWKGQQEEVWPTVGFLVVAIAGCCWFIGFLRNSVDVPKML